MIITITIIIIIIFITIIIVTTNDKAFLAEDELQINTSQVRLIQDWLQQKVTKI